MLEVGVIGSFGGATSTSGIYHPRIILGFEHVDICDKRYFGLENGFFAGAYLRGWRKKR